MEVFFDPRLRRSKMEDEGVLRSSGSKIEDRGSSMFGFEERRKKDVFEQPSPLLRRTSLLRRNSPSSKTLSLLFVLRFRDRRIPHLRFSDPKIDSKIAVESAVVFRIRRLKNVPSFDLRSRRLGRRSPWVPWRPSSLPTVFTLCPEDNRQL